MPRHLFIPRRTATTCGGVGPLLLIAPWVLAGYKGTARAERAGPSHSTLAPRRGVQHNALPQLRLMETATDPALGVDDDEVEIDEVEEVDVGVSGQASDAPEEIPSGGGLPYRDYDHRSMYLNAVDAALASNPLVHPRVNARTFSLPRLVSELHREGRLLGVFFSTYCLSIRWFLRSFPCLVRDASVPVYILHGDLFLGRPVLRPGDPHFYHILDPVDFKASQHAARAQRVGAQPGASTPPRGAVRRRLKLSEIDQHRL